MIFTWYDVFYTWGFCKVILRLVIVVDWAETLWYLVTSISDWKGYR